MFTAHEALVEIYRAMSDEELIERWVTGNLTEAAMSVAWSEFTRRGIQPPYVVSTGRVDDAADTDETVTFVTVARSLIPSELHILRARLEGDGIPSFIVDDNLTQMNPLWAVAVGGARLLVAQPYAVDAMQILTLLKSGRFALQDIEGEDRTV